jgi:hypothetical protein
MCDANCQPAIRRLNTSTTKLKNTIAASRAVRKVRDDSASNRAGVTSRLTMPGYPRRRIRVVVHHGLPRRLAPWR